MTAPLSARALAHVQAARDGRLDIRAPKGLLADLTALAEKRGITTSALAVEALARLVTERP